MHPLTTMTLSLIPGVCLAAGIAIGTSDRPAPPNTSCIDAEFRTVPTDSLLECRRCWWNADPPEPITEQSL